MTENEADAYLTVVEGWLRDNRGIHFTEGAVDDLCDRVAPVLADNARLRDALKEIEWSNDSKWQSDRARRALENKP